MEQETKPILRFSKNDNTEEIMNLEDVNCTPGFIDLSIEPSTIGIQEAYDKFKGVSELKLYNDGAVDPYGIYTNLVFSSATINSDETISVKFQVPTVDEIRLSNLEQAVEEHDLALASAVYGTIEED